MNARQRVAVLVVFSAGLAAGMAISANWRDSNASRARKAELRALEQGTVWRELAAEFERENQELAKDLEQARANHEAQ